MEMQIAGGKVGQIDYKIEFKDGKLCAEGVFDGGVLDGGLVLKLDAAAVLDALKLAIPGQFDDAIIEMAKAALLKK